MYSLLGGIAVRDGQGVRWGRRLVVHPAGHAVQVETVDALVTADAIGAICTQGTIDTIDTAETIATAVTAVTIDTERITHDIPRVVVGFQVSAAAFPVA